MDSEITNILHHNLQFSPLKLCHIPGTDMVSLLCGLFYGTKKKMNNQKKKCYVGSLHNGEKDALGVPLGLNVGEFPWERSWTAYTSPGLYWAGSMTLGRCSGD